MTLRGFLVYGTRPAPQRSAALRLAPPPGPTAGTLNQETWPRHRDLNRPSRDRDEVNSPNRPPGLGVTFPKSGQRWRGFIREDQAVAPKAAPSPHATRLRGLRRPTSRRCQQRQHPVQSRRPHTDDPRLRSSRHLRAGNSPCRSSALGLTNENGNAWHEALGLRALCVQYACTFHCSGGCKKIWGCGGEEGIRTLETVSRLHTIQACAFDHSATSPPTPLAEHPTPLQGAKPR